MHKFRRFLFYPLSCIIFSSFALLPCFVIFGPGNCTKLRFDYDEDTPLFLTPYVKRGEFEKARQAALVPPMLSNIESFSGFITVDRENNGNLFFWYFPAENSSEVPHNPVVLWLQGGPGESAMHGLLNQHGPFYLEKDGNLARRSHRWSKNFHMLYIDSPAGTGFSFVNKEYHENCDQAGADLYQALKQIFQIFPELQENEFFIAGESYAGKFIPALGRIIHRKNKVDSIKIQLKGLLIGNGMIDTEFFTYGNYLAELKIITTQELPDWLEKEEQFKIALQQKNEVEAETIFSEIQRKFEESVSVNMYNYLDKTKRNMGGEDRVLKDFLSKKDVRRRLHVGDTDFTPFNVEVQREMFWGDFSNKISPYTEELLENYRVLHYNGELDLVCHYRMTRAYVDSLEWSESEEYRSAGSRAWEVNGNLAGYVKSGGNLTVVVVKNAGHRVPKDQPEWALDLVTRFIRNQPLSS